MYAPDVFAEGYAFQGQFTIEQWWRGGMGIVYQVRDRVTGQEYAIKVPAAESDAAIAAQQFNDEVALWIQLPHSPHIVRAYRVGIERDRPFLLMEYVHGHTLAAELRAGSLDLARAVDLTSQICGGMISASSRGEITHRDLKPSNLLIAESGLLKITDFGMACETALTSGTQIRGRAGSPRYMSPEQILGETTGIQSDIFSVGVVFFEMLTGQLPYAAAMSGDDQIDFCRLTTMHRVLRKELRLTRQVAIDSELDYEFLASELERNAESADFALDTFARERLGSCAAASMYSGFVTERTYDRYPSFEALLEHLQTVFPEYSVTTTDSEVQELTPDDWYTRGLSLQKVGQDQEALQCFNRVLASQREHAGAWLAAALSYERLGQHWLSVETVKQAHVAVPDDEWISKQLALEPGEI